MVIQTITIRPQMVKKYKVIKSILNTVNRENNHLVYINTVDRQSYKYI